MLLPTRTKPVKLCSTCNCELDFKSATPSVVKNGGRCKLCATNYRFDYETKTGRSPKQAIWIAKAILVPFQDWCLEHNTSVEAQIKDFIESRLEGPPQEDALIQAATEAWKDSDPGHHTFFYVKSRLAEYVRAHKLLVPANQFQAIAGMTLLAVLPDVAASFESWLPSDQPVGDLVSFLESERDALKSVPQAPEMRTSLELIQSCFDKAVAKQRKDREVGIAF